MIMRFTIWPAALLFLLPAVIAQAQTTNTWTGAGASNTWSAAANWGGILPVNAANLVFSGTTRQTNTNDLTSVTNFSTVAFGSAGWNINGNGVMVTNAFTETATGSNTWGLATVLSNTVSIGQTAAGDTLNFTGVLSGSGGLATVAGAGGQGTVYLSNTNNSFTGGVTIASATGVFYSLANAGVNSSLGAGSGTITFGTTASAYTGSLIYAGTGNGVTGRAFTPAERTTGSPAFNNNSPGNANLTFNGGWTLHGNLNPFTLALGGSSTGTNTFNGVISQSSSYPVCVQVSGPGTWVFGANNTYGGTTTVNGGVLQLGAGGSAGNAGPAATNSIIFAGAGTLAVNRSDAPVLVNSVTLAGTDTFAVANGTAVTLGGVISGAGALTVNSPGGTLTLTNAETYTGATTVNAGKLALGAAGSLAGSPAINLGSGATWDVSAVSGGYALAAGQTLTGLGATGTIKGNLKLGAGSLVLDYTPGTPVLTVTGGALSLSNNSVTVTVPGSTALAVGNYELIAPGSGGSVTGSVATSLVEVNDTGDQTVALQIIGGGLYLVVTPSTAFIPTAVTLDASLNPAVYGTEPVVFTATVSPAPTNGETVAFMEGTNTLATTMLTNGATAFSTASLGLGLHYLTAVYGGDAVYEPGTSAVLTQLVSAAAVPYPQGTAFPLFLYEADPSFTNMTVCGWNIAQDYGQVTNTDVTGFLQGLATNDVTGVAVIPATGTADPYSEWTQTAVSNWVQSIAGGTNLAWWYLPEEMKPNNYTSERNLVRDYVAWTRLYDPAQRPVYEYTPNYFANTDLNGVASYVDVIGVSCYCEGVGMPHAWVRYKLQTVGAGGVALAGKTLGSNYLAGQKTLVAILYAAQDTNYAPSEPQPAQTYHDVWSAIASGAQGIGVWSYYHALHDDPANLTNNLNQLEAAALQLTGPDHIGSAVLFGTVNSNVTFQVTSGPTNTVSFISTGSTSTQYTSINVLAKTWNGNVYVIAVNSTSNTVAAVFTNVPSPLTAAAVPLEGRSVGMTNGSFSDTFSAWGVHVYKAATTLTAPVVYPPAGAGGGGAFGLSFSGANAQSYRVLAGTNLMVPLTNWQTVGRGTFGVWLTNFTEAATNGRRFYRVASP